MRLTAAVGNIQFGKGDWIGGRPALSIMTPAHKKRFDEAMKKHKELFDKEDETEEAQKGNLKEGNLFA